MRYLILLAALLFTGCGDEVVTQSVPTWGNETRRIENGETTKVESQKFAIGDIVYHAADKSFVGQVVNVTWHNRTWQYLVCFPPALKLHSLYAYEIRKK